MPASARLCPWTRTTLLTAHSFPPRTLPPRLHPPPLPPPPPPPVTPVATITCEPPPPPTRTTRPAEACCFPPAPQRNQGSAPTCASRPRLLRPPRHCCSRRYDVEASPAASVLSSASTAFGGRGSSVPHAAGSRQVHMPLPRAPPPIPNSFASPAAACWDGITSSVGRRRRRSAMPATESASQTALGAPRPELSTHLKPESASNR